MAELNDMQPSLGSSFNWDGEGIPANDEVTPVVEKDGVTVPKDKGGDGKPEPTMGISFEDFGSEPKTTSKPKAEKPKGTEAQETNEEGNEDEDDDGAGENDGEGSGENESGEESVQSAVAKALKETGFFQHAEIPDEDLSDDKITELYEQEFEGRVDDAVKEMFSEEAGFDEETRQFIAFKRNGGTTTDFLRTFGTEGFADDFDITKEANQRVVVRRWLREVEEMDENDIEDELAVLEEGKRLEKKAQVALNKFKQTDAKRKEELLASVEKAKENKLKELVAFGEKINKIVKDSTEIKLSKEVSIPLNKKDQAELGDYMSKPAIKKGNNKITQLQNDLNDVFASPEKMVVLAKFLKAGFSTKEFEKKAKSEQTRGIKNSIENRVQTTVARNNRSKRNLADVFPGLKS
jgi:hypothetical protein